MLPVAVIALAAEPKSAVTAQEPQMRVLVAEGSFSRSRQERIELINNQMDILIFISEY